MSERTSSESRRSQIARELRHDIETGRLPSSQKLPTSRVLAEKYDVSLATVNLAMEDLDRLGLIVTRPRSGRFVADRAGAAGTKPRPRHRAVFIGGHDGSGKTEVARVLARETGWAILDKDTLTRYVVDTALVQLGSTIADRESKIYTDIVEPAAYRCLDATVIENLTYGVNVIAAAPYLREFGSRAWLERQAAALDELGADMSVIWVRCSAETMHSYIRGRAVARDTWKLAHWDEYLDKIDLDFEPRWPHTVIDNDADNEPIQTQVKAFLRSIGTMN
jgi:DNA-binding transcriptional regulator YhcF (GntR family)/predicted kinase